MSEPLNEDAIEDIVGMQQRSQTGPLRYVHVHLCEVSVPELLAEVDRLRAENRQLTNANAHLQQEVNFLRRRPE